MPYTRQQISNTVSYIIQDAFCKESAKTQQFLKTSLKNIFSRLTKSNPAELKFTLDKRNPHLFTEFFDWLDENKVAFPKYTRYVLKRDGSSVADHDGDLKLINKVHKVSSKQVNHYDDIIEGLRDFHLERQRVLSARQLTEEPSYYSGSYNNDGYDPEGYDQDDYDQDDYDQDEDTNSQLDLDEPSSDSDSYQFVSQSDSDEFSIDEDSDFVDSDHDSAREAAEQKERAALTFNRSNQSKTQRSLYVEAKKLAQIAKDEAIAKRKEERSALQTVDVSSAKRFTKNPEKLLKTTPMLDGFARFKEKANQDQVRSNVRHSTDVAVRKPKLSMA